MSPCDGAFRFPGDTHFVFFGPEPPFEDIPILEELISRSVLSPKAATIVRVVGGRMLDSEQELIDCGHYGQAERNSDPHIGALQGYRSRAGRHRTGHLRATIGK
jgi:hypothetical protein